MSGFDLQAFRGAKFAERRAEVEVETLAEFFGEGPPVWTVRGLTAAELARASEAEAHRRNIQITADAISGLTGDGAAELKKLFGAGGEVPADTARRLELLALGSVAPAVDVSDAVRLADAYPIEFLRLTNKILELSALGKEAQGKRMPSGN